MQKYNKGIKVTFHEPNIEKTEIFIQYEDGGQIVVPLAQAADYGIDNPLETIGEYREI